MIKNPTSKTLDAHIKWRYDLAQSLVKWGALIIVSIIVVGAIQGELSFSSDYAKGCYTGAAPSLLCAINHIRNWLDGER